MSKTNDRNDSERGNPKGLLPDDVSRTLSVPTALPGSDVLDPLTTQFYCRALSILNAAGIPFLVGGAYAFERYTGIARHTKDFDLFVRRDDIDRALAAFDAEGFHTELTFPHWLGKAHCGADFIDLIFSSGNGVAPVDEGWFEHAVDAEVFGMKVQLCPVVEIIWQKALIMERERFDGGDVAHLLRGAGEQLDWARLLRRFGENWRVLFAHLILFGYIYPGERTLIPKLVMHELARRLEAETLAAPTGERICRGTIISRAQYLIDVNRWGYVDARLGPDGTMEPAEVALWTGAIEQPD